MAKVLFLAFRFPFPQHAGDKIKSYNLLKHLGSKHETTLVSLSHRYLPDHAWIAEVERLGVRVFAFTHNPIWGGLNAIANLFGKNPLEIDFYFNSEMNSLVQDLLKHEQFDIVIPFFMRTAQYVDHISDESIKKILIAEDCRILYQSRSSSNSTNFIQKFVRNWEVFKLLKYEPQEVAKFDATTFVTQADIDAISHYQPHARYAVVTNGVDEDSFQFIPSQEQRLGIGFWGKLDIWSNQMMAREVLEQIGPRVREIIGDDNLPIVIGGGYPPQWMKDYARKDKRFTLIPNPIHINEVGHRVSLLLNPHRGASGIQNKVLQAMAMGCPVVTTKTGIQGIPARHEFHFMEGDSTEELAQGCAKLLQNQVFAESVATNAYQLVNDEFSWNNIYRQLDTVIDELLV